MAARRRQDESVDRRRKPATTPEARENEMIALAMDRAEAQIHDGTASSQVISHFLKLGSTRERLEQQRVFYENELLKAKRERLESEKRVEELYIGALDAMRSYQGQPPLPREDDED